jgi:hypothetical protein
VVAGPGIHLDPPQAVGGVVIISVHLDDVRAGLAAPPPEHPAHTPRPARAVTPKREL